MWMKVLRQRFLLLNEMKKKPRIQKKRLPEKPLQRRNRRKSRSYQIQNTTALAAAKAMMMMMMRKTAVYLVQDPKRSEEERERREERKEIEQDRYKDKDKDGRKKRPSRKGNKRDAASAPSSSDSNPEEEIFWPEEVAVLIPHEVNFKLRSDSIYWPGVGGSFDPLLK